MHWYGKQLVSYLICRMKEHIDKTVSTIDRFDLFTIVFDILISIVGGLIINRLIPILKDKFIRAQLWGYDLNKKNSREIKM